MKSLLKRELFCGQRRFTSQQSARRLARRARGLRLEWLEQRTLLASDITILDSGVGTLDGFLGPADGTLTTADGGAVAGTMSRAALEGVGAGVDISITATTSITFEDLGSPLALQTGTGNSAAFDSGTGALSITDPDDSLTTAGGAIALTAGTDLIIGNLDSGGGSIMVFANNAVSVANIDVGAGIITVSANQDALGTNSFNQTAGAITTTNQTAGAVSITVNTAAGGTGEANLLAINAGTTGGVVTVAANGGPIIDADADTTDITSFQATLSGQFIAAAANPLDTAVNVLNADTSAANGNQNLREASGLTELNLNAGNSGDINLTLVAGAIQSADAGTDVSGDVVVLEAVTGIGTAANPIATALFMLEAETDTGGIFINNTGALAIGSVNPLTGLTVQTSGDIVLVNNGSITLTDEDGNETVLGGGTSGNVSLTANGAAANIISNVDQDAISAPGGNITLVAGRDISFGTIGNDFDNDVRANGTVSFTAGRDINIDGFSDIASDDFFNNSGSNLTFLAGRNINLQAGAGTDATVAAGGSASADVILTTGANGFLTLNATGASALSSNTGDVTVNADRVAIDSGSGITANNGIVVIRPVTAGRLLDLGSATNVAVNTLELSDAELDRVFSPLLRIGSAASGNLSVTGAIGPANVSALSLQTGGAIADATGGEQADAIVANLLLQAGAGIGAANDLDIDVDNLAFTNSGGAVNISNTGALTISAVAGATASSNTGTTTTISAASPLTFALNTTTAGDTTYTAGETIDPVTLVDDLTVNTGVTVSVTGGNLTLQAGDQILLNGGSTVSASGTITLSIGFGDLDNSGGATIQGTVNSGSGIPSVVGGPQVDVVLVDFTGGASLPDDLDIQGGGGTDFLTVSDAGGAVAHAYVINGASVTRDVVTTISATGVENVAVTGGNASDTFSVTPAVMTTFFIDGNNPTPPASPGDGLTVDTGGTTSPMLTSTSTPDGLQGSYSFGNRQPVNFQEIETLGTVADLAVTKDDSPDPVLAGTNLTYAITVTNVGTVDAQSVSLTDATPTNTTFVSFTAPAGWSAMTPPVGGTGTVTATNPTVAAGAVATFTLVVNVDSTAASEISNTVTVTTTTVEGNVANNSDTETTSLESLGLPECEVITLNSPGDPGTATLEDDADNPGSGVLIVTGTTGKDVIVIEPRPTNRSQIRVKINGQLAGLFSLTDVQHIVAFGLAGNDKIVVNATLLQPATLFGDEGNDYLYGAKGADGLEGGSGTDRMFGGSNNDTLCGGDGNDFVYGQAGNDFAGGDAGNDKVFGEAGNDFLLGNDGNDSVFGGAGNDRMFGQAGNDQIFGEAGSDIGVGGDSNDKLYGGSGRDVLIGGDGLDTLFGEAHDDILIAGSTSYDEDDEALQAILAEWTSANSYATRVNNLRNGGGANGAIVLDSTTVSDDGLIDTLWGDGGLDWFLFGGGDKLKDKVSSELVN